MENYRSILAVYSALYSEATTSKKPRVLKDCNNLRNWLIMCDFKQEVEAIERKMSRKNQYM